MKLQSAIKRLHEFDMKGHYVYRHGDLRKLFIEDSERAFTAGLKRLLNAGVLERVVRGVYVYCLSSRTKSVDTIEHIAKALRQGEYNYISLESALSEYGVISQIPIDRLTIGRADRARSNVRQCISPEVAASSNEDVYTSSGYGLLC